MNLSLILLGYWLSATPSTPVCPVSVPNVLTLPSHRHVVQVDAGPGKPPIWLFALQQRGAEGQELGLFRSDDGGAHWRHYAPIYEGERYFRADLIVVGQDVGMALSYEGYDEDTGLTHDVYFQWWRYQNGEFVPEPRVKVFDSDSLSTSWYRAMLARDSLGRLWIQAYFTDDDGSQHTTMAVSTDEGKSFTVQPWLERDLGDRGGGGLVALGTKLLSFYDTHGGGTPARYRLREDSWPVGQWGPLQQEITEGFYHGAALSAVADGQGGMHLVYKDEGGSLHHRRFDGTRFGEPTTLQEGKSGDWAVQPTIALQGDTLVVFYLRTVVKDRNLQLLRRTLKDGVWSDPVEVDGSPNFKGYPQTLPVVPPGHRVPVFWGQAATNANSGHVMQSFYVPPDYDPSNPFPQPPSAQETLLFEDEFSSRLALAPGVGWEVGSGGWSTQGQLLARGPGTSRAVAWPRCLACRAGVEVVALDQGAGLSLRESGESRYEALLRADSTLVLRRVLGRVATTLAQAPTRVSGQSASLEVSVSGSGPVVLEARVDGATVLSHTDRAPEALTRPGAAGVLALGAGPQFDHFRLFTTDRDPLGGVLFADDFERQATSLGPDWESSRGPLVVDGVVTSQGYAQAAAQARPLCADCRVEALVTTRGKEARLSLRQQASGERYEVVLRDSTVLLRRWGRGTTSVLGWAPVGALLPDRPASLALEAEGTADVRLTVVVNGQPALALKDSGALAITSPGAATFTLEYGGLSLDQFRLWSGGR